MITFLSWALTSLSISKSEDFVAAVRDYSPDGVELVIDMIGGETLAKGYQTLRKGGRMALLVGTARSIVG